MTKPLPSEEAQRRLEEMDEVLAELAQQEQSAEVRHQAAILEQERDAVANRLYPMEKADIAAWQTAAREKAKKAHPGEAFCFSGKVPRRGRAGLKKRMEIQPFIRLRRKE